MRPLTAFGTLDLGARDTLVFRARPIGAAEPMGHKTRPRQPDGWIHPLVAVGRVRRGRRGFFVLGERPDGAPRNTLRPMVAWGVLDAAGVHVTSGTLAPRFRVLLAAEAPWGRQ